MIRIDIPNRSMDLLIDDKELEQRRKEADSKPDGWKPVREREVTTALKAYASMVSSADKGAIRIVKEY
jgi:dihydroxy-acid dehydratase